MLGYILEQISRAVVIDDRMYQAFTLADVINAACTNVLVEATL